MSTLTTPTSATTQVPAGNARRRAAGLALIAGPLMLVAANLLALGGDTTDPGYLRRLPAHAGTEQVSILLFIAAFTVLIAGVVGLAGRVTGRGARLAATGSALATAGSVGFACLVVSGVFNIAAAATLPVEQAKTLVDKAGSLPAAAVLVVLGLLALPIGYILLAAGAWRARFTPSWVPLVVFAAFAILTVLDGRVGGIAGDVVLLVGLGYPGLRLMRDPA